MKAKEFIIELKKESKPRNPVAKNAMATIGGGGAGPHKNEKKAAKQGDVKHKNKEYAESLDEVSWQEIRKGATAAGLAGAMAFGASGANARVTPGDDPSINRLTGKPIATQQATDTAPAKAQAPKGFSKEYLQAVVDGKHPRPMVSVEKAQELLKNMSEGNLKELFEPTLNYYKLSNGKTVQASYRPAPDQSPVPFTDVEVSYVNPALKPQGGSFDSTGVAEPWTNAPDGVKQAIQKFVAKPQQGVAEGNGNEFRIGQKVIYTTGRGEKFPSIVTAIDFDEDAVKIKSANNKPFPNNGGDIEIVVDPGWKFLTPEPRVDPDSIIAVSPSMRKTTERVRDPEGNTEPPNNFAIYVNGNMIAVRKGRGQYADDYREKAHYQQLKDLVAKKSAETGKKWSVSITGKPATE